MKEEDIELQNLKRQAMREIANRILQRFELHKSKKRVEFGDSGIANTVIIRVYVKTLGNLILRYNVMADCMIFSVELIVNITNRIKPISKISKPSRYKLLKLSGALFSEKTQKEIFENTMADWDFEIFEAVSKDKDAKLFMINVRNTYSFLAAMWQKSPFGDLIEFVVKIAKG